MILIILLTNMNESINILVMKVQYFAPTNAALREPWRFQSYSKSSGSIASIGIAKNPTTNS